MKSSDPVTLILAILIFAFIIIPLAGVSMFGIYKTITAEKKEKPIVRCVECGYSESLVVYHNRIDGHNFEFILPEENEQ